MPVFFPISCAYKCFDAILVCVCVYDTDMSECEYVLYIYNM